MDTLNLARAYLRHYNVRSKKNVEDFLDSTTTELFELGDANCRPLVFAPSDGDLRVENDRNDMVGILVLDGLVKSTSLQGHKTCDYVLFDTGHNHFVLAELTNSRTEYVASDRTSGRMGKEDYAKVQLKATVERLQDIPAIGAEIASFKRRSLVLGIHLSEEKNDRAHGLLRQVRRSPSARGYVDHNFINGYTLYKVIYPECFQF